MTNAETFQMDSPESWEIARGYASLFGAIPATFTTTLRFLIQDQEKNSGQLSSTGRFHALRLIKGKSLKAPFYFAVLSFKPGAFKDAAHISDDDLLRVFSPGDVAALFGLIYLYKKAKALCLAEEWAYLAPPLLQELELGGKVGFALPKVGLAAGLLTRTIRHISVATFLRHDKKHFQQFRRALKAESILNIQNEFQAWGCTDLQVASIFLQTFGFGIEYANGFARALAQEGPLTETTPATPAFKVADFWTTTLLATGKIPDIKHDSRYYPPDDLRRGLEEAAAARDSIPLNHWIDKGKDDINPQNTPQLADESSEKIDEEIKEVEQEIS